MKDLDRKINRGMSNAKQGKDTWYHFWCSIVQGLADAAMYLKNKKK